MNSTQIDMKDIVLNAKEPLVIQNTKVPWPCFEITFDKWCKELDEANNDTKLEFDSGKSFYHNKPQWERTRTKVEMTASKFLAKCAANEFGGNWVYYNYKNIKELPEMASNKDVSFAFMGFPEIKEDITVWLGSKHAHTPCHYDSYGCNIVVQVYGRKSWLLFPRESKLTCTRVPYEESSIYCKENFYSPSNFETFRAVKDCAYHITLNPGDILVVPPKWWHYVESLEPSLNFNTWIPLERDTESQIEECITGIIMREFTQNSSNEIQNIIFNPNEDINLNSNSLYSILNVLIKHKSEDQQNEKKIKFHKYPSFYYENENYINLLNKYSYNNNISFVTKISSDSFERIIQINSKRFVPHMSDENVENNNSMIDLLNAICNPNVIKLIKEIYVHNEEK